MKTSHRTPQMVALAMLLVSMSILMTKPDSLALMIGWAPVVIRTGAIFLFVTFAAALAVVMYKRFRDMRK